MNISDLEWGEKEDRSGKLFLAPKQTQKGKVYYIVVFPDQMIFRRSEDL